MRKPGKRTIAAHHEAGHAVVAVVLGVRVGRVAIGTDGTGSGCRVLRPPAQASLRRILAYAATHLAGGLAEERLMAPLGMRWEGPSILPGGFDDECNFRAWIREALHVEIALEDAIFLAVVNRVRQLLARGEIWRAVLVVAEHLLRQGEISGAEARAIVKTARVSKKPSRYQT